MREQDTAKEGAFWLLTALERLFSDVDRDGLVREVAALRQRFPGEPAPRLARRFIGETALLSGVRGGLLSIPRSLPGAGWALGIVGASVDTLALVREQSLLIFKVAALYEHSLYEPARIVEALAIFGILTGEQDAVGELERVLRTLPEGALRGAGLAIAREAAIVIGKRLAGRGLLKWLPLVGIPLGGAMNYVSTEDVGTSAIRFYSRRNVSQRLLGDVVEAEKRDRNVLLDLYLYLHSTEAALPDEVKARALTLGRSLGIADPAARLAAVAEGAGPSAASLAAAVADAEGRRRLYERAVLMADSLPSEFQRGFLLANLADALGVAEDERQRVAAEVRRFLDETLPGEETGLLERLGSAAGDAARSAAETGRESLSALAQGVRRWLGVRR